MKAVYVLLISMCVAVPAYADSLVAKGAKATLSVEYSYESRGTNNDKYDLHEWSVTRVAKLSSTLIAQSAQPLPSMQPMEAAQEAGMKNKQDIAVSAQKKMAPMMADIQKFMEKCGEDEACMEREIQNYGMNTKVTPEVASVKQDVQALSKQDAPRYQVWSSYQQSGTYSIDETEHRLDADPLCMEKPTKRCTIDTTRKGAGAIPLPPTERKDKDATTGYAAVEVDSVKNTLVIALPMPMLPMPYTQTVTTNHPEHKSGTSQQLINFARMGDTRWGDKPITVAIKGDLRQQSGEQTIKLIGKAGEGGVLKVRWRFTPST